MSELRRKLRWLIAIRAVISTVLLGSATFAQITAPGSFPVDPFFFLIGLTYALTAIYAGTLRLVERYRWLVDLQLAGDVLIVSAFIYFTGGITSYFSSLYVLPIVAASTVQFRRGGLLVAASERACCTAASCWRSTSPRPGCCTIRGSSSMVLPPRSVAAVHVLAEHVRVLRRGASSADRSRKACDRPARDSCRRRRRSPTCRRSISTSSTACRAGWRRPTSKASC